ELGDAPVQLQLALAAGYVVVGDGRGERQVDGDLGEGGRPWRAALLVHGLLEELGVELETDRRDVPVLLRAEDVPRPADLEVVHGDLEARPELARLAHRLNALPS